VKKETKYVCLDTSFIESQNFLEGHKFRELGNLNRLGEIKVLISEIVYKEVVIRFKKNIGQANEIINSLKTKLGKDGKAIKNLSNSETYFKIPTIDAKKAVDEFKEKFDDFISYHQIEIIESKQLNIYDILDDYFLEKPPFHNEKKKHEFPDAIIIKTYETYLDSIGVTGNFFSKDKDILGYKSKSLNITDDDSGFIYSLIKSYQSKQEKKDILDQIEKLFQNSRESIEAQTRAIIEADLLHKYWPLNDDHEFEELLNPVIHKTLLGDYSIVFLNFLMARLETNIELEFEADICFKDYTKATFDKEKEEWSGIENQNKHIVFKNLIPIELTVENNPVAGRFYSDIRLEQVNTFKYINISKYVS
jgi:PIN domain